VTISGVERQATTTSSSQFKVIALPRSMLCNPAYEKQDPGLCHSLCYEAANRSDVKGRGNRTEYRWQAEPSETHNQRVTAANGGQTRVPSGSTTPEINLFYGTWSFITVYTRAKWIQSNPPPPQPKYILGCTF
jgi:hypothetical protein